MRSFVLYTPNKAQSFALNDKALAAEPAGLGNNFSISYKDTPRGKRYSNVVPEFEPITLMLYFNADGTSGYANYNALASFLTLCGKTPFMFEYNDGVMTKYCDVITKTMPKSEINEEGLFAETFTFERQNYWYTENQDEFSLISEVEASAFPLDFNIGFNGVATAVTSTKIINTFFEEAPTVITIRGKITSSMGIFLKDEATGDIIREILITATTTDNTIITINAKTQKIIVDDGNTIANGYDLTDKTKSSFLFIPQGEFILGATMENFSGGEIVVSVQKYLLD